MSLDAHIENLKEVVTTSFSETDAQRKAKRKYNSLRNIIKAKHKLKMPETVMNRQYEDFAEEVGISAYEVGVILEGVGVSTNPMVADLFKEIATLVYLEQPERLKMVEDTAKNAKIEYDRLVRRQEMAKIELAEKYPLGSTAFDELKIDVSGWSEMCDDYEKEVQKYSGSFKTAPDVFKIFTAIIVAKSRYFVLARGHNNFSEFDFEEMKNFNREHIRDIIMCTLQAKHMIETDDKTSFHTLRGTNINIINNLLLLGFTF